MTCETDPTWELFKFDTSALFVGLLAVAWPLLFALPLVLAINPSAGWVISLLFYVNVPFAFRLAWFLLERRFELTESFSDEPAQSAYPTAEATKRATYISKGDRGDVIIEASTRLEIPDVSPSEIEALERRQARREEHLA